MNDVAMVGSAMGIALATATGMLIRSAKEGYLNEMMDKKANADEAHKAMAGMVDAIERIEHNVSETRRRVERLDSKVERLDTGLDNVSRTIAVVHSEDEDIDTDVLRERLEVTDLDEDFYRGG